MAHIHWDSCVATYRAENVTPWAMTLSQWLAAAAAGHLEVRALTA